jgi:lycopene cyclase-like protein
MALTSLLFVPQYWTSPRFSTSIKTLESELRTFCGRGSWWYRGSRSEIFLREGLASIRNPRHKRHYAPFVVLLGVFVRLEAWHPHKTMDYTIISFSVGAIILAYLRRDLIPLMLTFTVLCFVLFLWVLALYPEFVRLYYNLPNLLGIFAHGVPIEELPFAATGGAIWSANLIFVS